MLNCTITIQWPHSFVLIGSEIEREFLSCILAHPELFLSLSRISFSFPFPHPCPNFGESCFPDSSQNPGSRSRFCIPLMFLESRTVFWSNLGFREYPFQTHSWAMRWSSRILTFRIHFRLVSSRPHEFRSERSELSLRSGQASDEVARSRGILNRIGGRTFSLHADELTSAWLLWPSLSFPSVLELKTSWLHSF